MNCIETLNCPSTNNAGLNCRQQVVLCRIVIEPSGFAELILKFIYVYFMDLFCLVCREEDGGGGGRGRGEGGGGERMFSSVLLWVINFHAISQTLKNCV